MHNSTLNDQCQQKLPLRVGHQEDQAQERKQQTIKREKSTLRENQGSKTYGRS